MFLLLNPWFAQLCTDETRFEPQGFDHTRLSFIKFSSGSLNLNWKVNFWTKNVYGFQSEILYTLMLTSLLSPHPGRLLGLFGNNKMSWRNPAEDLVADRDAVQTEMWQKRPKIQEMWSISPLHQVGPLSPLSVLVETFLFLQVRTVLWWKCQLCSWYAASSRFVPSIIIVKFRIVPLCQPVTQHYIS